MSHKRTTGELPASPSARVALPEALRYAPACLNRTEQESLVAELRAIVEQSPFFTPRMPRTGKPFSVRMTNCGPLGWLADLEGYRYQSEHPVTGRQWPRIPPRLLELWEKLAGYPHPPEACLVNYYAPAARMGLHQDRDERNLVAPVLSLSLGDTCVFRIGGRRRTSPTRSFRLASGDVVILGGPSRLAYHGVDRIIPGSSTLLRDWLPDGGRINLTLRRVSPAPGG